MHKLVFENSIADALAYFQSAKIPRNAFRPWVFLYFGEPVGALKQNKTKQKKALNCTGLISKDFLKLRVRMNIQYGCIMLCN